MHYTASKSFDFTHTHYRQTSNVRHSLMGNEIVDYSADVVGATTVGANPTTFLFST